MPAKVKTCAALENSPRTRDYSGVLRILGGPSWLVGRACVPRLEDQTRDTAPGRAYEVVVVVAVVVLSVVPVVVVWVVPVVVVVVVPPPSRVVGQAPDAGIGRSPCLRCAFTALPETRIAT
jgi:hypothetical protein